VQEAQQPAAQESEQPADIDFYIDFSDIDFYIDFKGEVEAAPNPVAMRDAQAPDMTNEVDGEEGPENNVEFGGEKGFVKAAVEAPSGEGRNTPVQVEALDMTNEFDGEEGPENTVELGGEKGFEKGIEDTAPAEDEALFSLALAAVTAVETAVVAPSGEDRSTPGPVDASEETLPGVAVAAAAPPTVNAAYLATHLADAGCQAVIMELAGKDALKSVIGNNAKDMVGADEGAQNTGRGTGCMPRRAKWADAPGSGSDAACSHELANWTRRAAERAVVSASRLAPHVEDGGRNVRDGFWGWWPVSTGTPSVSTTKRKRNRGRLQKKSSAETVVVAYVGPRTSRSSSCVCVV
jgi:hypothetical protein